MYVTTTTLPAAFFGGRMRAHGNGTTVSAFGSTSALCPAAANQAAAPTTVKTIDQALVAARDGNPGLHTRRRPPV